MPLGDWRVDRAPSCHLGDRATRWLDGQGVDPRAWKQIQRAYKALGVEEHLRMDSFDGAHRWNGVKVESVLASVLNP